MEDPSNLDPAMSLANSASSYGTVARFFHWTTALLILTAIPLGLVAHGLPYETDAQLARKATLFSIHKTVGVTAFFVALARIFWAALQSKPSPVHPERGLETWAAETAHWLLYASMVIVPLSGWLHHAATTGFAPILWPFGQSLPFVPVNAAVADVFAALHWVFTKVLGIAVFLHIAGALKHAVIDRDGVLARMATGRPAGDGTDHASRAPLVSAGLVVAVAIAGGTALGWPKAEPETEALVAVESGWTVETGTLGIAVVQLGGTVGGSFADWTAAIDFDPDAAGEIKGSVEVTIAIASLTLGTVTQQAMGPDHFHTEAHPTATFQAEIRETGTGYVADGTLTVKDNTAPVTLPFELALDGDAAQVRGMTTLDRRDFNIGESLKDETSLGFPVEVTVELTARRN